MDISSLTAESMSLVLSALGIVYIDLADAIAPLEFNGIWSKNLFDTLWIDTFPLEESCVVNLATSACCSMLTDEFWMTFDEELIFHAVLPVKAFGGLQL